MKRLLLNILALLTLSNATRAEVIDVALYDVGRLYDTIPSPFYDDSDYTPRGKMQWNSERYRRKIENITSVIDTLETPLVVLYGVENREVARDIQRTSKRDYSLLHRDLDYYNGLDFALLYYGDVLYINNVHNHSHYTFIGGEIDGKSIGIHLTRRGDKLLTTLPPYKDKPAGITLAWGRLNPSNLKRLGMDDPMREVEKAGRGDTYSQHGWYVANRVGVTTNEEVSIKRCALFIAPYIIDSKRYTPLPTLSKDGYIGGYSHHLPQIISIEYGKKIVTK